MRAAYETINQWLPVQKQVKFTERIYRRLYIELTAGLCLKNSPSVYPYLNKILLALRTLESVVGLAPVCLFSF